MATDTITVSNLTTATLLVPAGAGPTLVVNNGPGILYVGDDNSIRWNDGGGVIPLAAGATFAVSGDNDFFGTPAPASNAALGIVQSSITLNSLTPSFANPTTPGNTIVVAILSANTTSGDVPSVSGVTIGGIPDKFASAANAVTAFLTGTVSAYALASLWTDFVCVGNQTAIVVSGANLNVLAFATAIYEVSGLFAGTVDNARATPAAAVGMNWSSGATPNSTAANEIWFGAATTIGQISPPGSPWNNLVTGNEFASAYQIVSSIGAAAYSGTQNTADAWAALAVQLKPGAAPVNQANPCFVSTIAGGLSSQTPKA